MTDYFQTGFAVRKPTWHQKEKLLDYEPSSWEEACEVAGLVDPIELPIYLPDYIDGVDSPPWVGDTGEHEAPGWRALVNPRSGSVMSMQRDSYRVIPLSVLGEVRDVMEEASGGKLHYDCVGALREGRQVFVTLLLDEPHEIPGDPSPHLPYVVLTNSYDGTLPLGVRQTRVRVVCANTETWSREMANAGRGGYYETFRHTKNWRLKVEDAKRILTHTREAQAAYDEWARVMMLRAVSPVQEQQFVSRLIGADKVKNIEISTQVENNIDADREKLRKILTGPTVEGIRGTAYGLVQAGSEFLEHHARYRSQDAVIQRSLLGDQKRTAKLEDLAMAASG